MLIGDGASAKYVLAIRPCSRGQLLTLESKDTRAYNHCTNIVVTIVPKRSVMRHEGTKIT